MDPNELSADGKVNSLETFLIVRNVKGGRTIAVTTQRVDFILGMSVMMGCVVTTVRYDNIRKHYFLVYQVI